MPCGSYSWKELCFLTISRLLLTSRWQGVGWNVYCHVVVPVLNFWQHRHLVVPVFDLAHDLTPRRDGRPSSTSSQRCKLISSGRNVSAGATTRMLLVTPSV